MLAVIAWTTWVVMRVMRMVDPAVDALERSHHADTLDRVTAERDMYKNLYHQTLKLPPPPSTPPHPTDPLPRNRRLVAVFPDVGLDFTPEIAYLRQSGGAWELKVIEGNEATRSRIAEELRAGKGARLLYLASHSADKQLLLTGNEVITPAWLATAIRFFSIEVVVMNSCTSDELAEACEAAGVQAVVVTTDAIMHQQAVKFAVALLSAVARGEPLSRAITYAHLSVDDVTGEIVRVRGNEGWTWA